MALARWQQTVEHLEQHPDWRQTWANALWDTWCYRKQKAVINDIPLDVRRALVQREMAADQWFGVLSPQYENNTTENTPDNTAENTALDKLKIHLVQHPEDGDLSYRKLADAAQVSINTVQRFRQTQSGNGRGN